MLLGKEPAVWLRAEDTLVWEEAGEERRELSVALLICDPCTREGEAGRLLHGGVQPGLYRDAAGCGIRGPKQTHDSWVWVSGPMRWSQDDWLGTGAGPYV